jgi:hypothetical protein
MKFRLEKGLAGLVLLGSASLANAALITETWESEITYVSNPTAFSAGDTFTWMVTYDNSSQQMSSWNDSFNGISEFGKGDDTLDYTWCITGASGPCDVTLSPGDWKFFANAVFDVSAFVDPMLASGIVTEDVLNVNYSRAFDDSSGIQFRDIYADFLWFDKNGASIFNDATIGRYRTYMYFQSHLMSSVLVESVPAPAPLSLIGLGLFALGHVRKRIFC